MASLVSDGLNSSPVCPPFTNQVPGRSSVFFPKFHFPSGRLGVTSYPPPWLVVKTGCSYIYENMVRLSSQRKSLGLARVCRAATVTSQCWLAGVL